MRNKAKTALVAMVVLVFQASCMRSGYNLQDDGGSSSDAQVDAGSDDEGLADAGGDEFDGGADEQDAGGDQVDGGADEQDGGGDEFDGGVDAADEVPADPPPDPIFELNALVTGNTTLSTQREVRVSMVPVEAAGYLMSETADLPPEADDPGWSIGPPETFELSDGNGLKTVYLWLINEDGITNPGDPPSSD